MLSEKFGSLVGWRSGPMLRNPLRTTNRIATRVCRTFAILVVGAFLLLPARISGTEETCLPLRLKPLRCVCGIIKDLTGEPVTGATVTIFENGSELVARHTGDDGKFSFDSLKAGHYDIQIQVSGFRVFRLTIVVVKPESRCKQALEVRMTTGYPENCTGVRLVKAIGFAVRR